MRDKIDTRMLFENLQRFQDSLQEQEFGEVPPSEEDFENARKSKKHSSGDFDDAHKEDKLLDIAKKLVECLENQNEEEAYELCKELHSKFRKKMNDNDVEFN